VEKRLAGATEGEGGVYALSMACLMPIPVMRVLKYLGGGVAEWGNRFEIDQLENLQLNFNV
jgi:hypothetical protein